MSAVHLIACPRPFSMQRIERELPEGGTIADMLRAIDLDPDLLHARVFIDDRLILKAEWEHATPRAGQFVTARVIPTGGGGGKDALRIVAMIGVVVASFFTAGGALAGGAGLLGGGGAWAGATAAGFGAGGLGSAVAGVAVGIAGSLAVGALIPPAKPKLQDLSRLNLSPALSLTGTSNQLAPYAPIPRVYGRYRMFPPLAARTFTETVGNDQYLRMLFCCGYGPLALSELKIGQTPIAQFEDVEMEIRYGFPNDLPITLFPDDVYEDALSILMDDGVWQQRTTQRNAREVVLEFTFPGGLWFLISGINRYDAGAVDFAVEYRAVGEVAWTELLPNEPAATAQLDLGSGHSAIRFESEGAAGNQWYVSLSPTNSAIDQPVVTFSQNICLVYYPVGTMAYQIVGAIAAADQQGLRPQLGVRLAPGSDGTGLVGSADGYLTGGKDAKEQLVISRNSFTPFLSEVRFAVPDPAVQYEVRVKATKFPSPDYTRNDTVYWTMLRTIQVSEPVSKPGLCLVALRIKATNQLNGTLDQFNCLAESILPDWTGSAWLERPTSNPASIYRNILQGSANARPLPDSRVDLTRLAAFHDSCTAQGWRFNANIDYRSTVNELSRDVLAAGRASLHQQDGKFTVVEDLSQALPKQLITPRNSWGFRGTRVFSDLPHALKVRFVNPEKDWQQDERIVYADGYSEATASQFEALELTGITDPEQAWKLARYHLAVATLRPETYEVNLDVEHLVCSRGDLVLVQHDVPLFGLITGRIKAVTTDSYGRATALTLDEPCVMQAGDRYGVRVRLQDNTYVQREVLNVPGSHTTVTLLSPI